MHIINKCYHYTMRDLVSLVIGYAFKHLLHQCDVCDSDKCKLLSFTVQKTSFKQHWFAKCLAEEVSVYTQRAMVSAS